jgi:hypothetical protein
VDVRDRNRGDDGNGDSAHDDVDNDGVARQVDYSFLPVFAAGCDKALVIVSNRMFRTPSAVLQLFAAMAVHCEPERVCTFDALNACIRLWRTLWCCLDNADRVLKCSRCSFLSSRLLCVATAMLQPRLTSSSSPPPPHTHHYHHHHHHHHNYHHHLVFSGCVARGRLALLRLSRRAHQRL